MTEDNAPISLRAYAQHRKSTGLTGTSITAVTKAIESGRLCSSVVSVGGRPKIRDASQADREWSSNTLDPSGRRPSRARAMATEAPDLAPHPVDHGARPGQVVAEDDIDYAEARRRREIELWRQARVKRHGDELELAERQGELVSVDEAKAEIVERYTRARTKLLALPSRIKQRVPDLTVEDVTLIESLIREALEDLAADDA